MAPTTTDPLERAKAHAAQMYPGGEVVTRSVHGRPVIVVKEGNLLRILSYRKLDAGAGKNSVTA